MGHVNQSCRTESGFFRASGRAFGTQGRCERLEIVRGKGENMVFSEVTGAWVVGESPD